MSQHRWNIYREFMEKTPLTLSVFVFSSKLRPFSQLKLNKSMHNMRIFYSIYHISNLFNNYGRCFADTISRIFDIRINAKLRRINAVLNRSIAIIGMFRGHSSGFYIDN